MMTNSKRGVELRSEISWARPILNKNNKALLVETTVETKYSTVHKLLQGDQFYFLKKVPAKLYLEPIIVKYLISFGCQCLPNIIGVNDGLHCFLMKSSGDLTLKAFFENRLDKNLLENILYQYAKIQRQTEDKLDELLTLGLQDWRLAHFATKFSNLSECDVLLRQAGLTDDEQSVLKNLNSYVSDLCDVLLQYELPATISHCDFHPGNVIYNSVSKEMTIIDWGESVISHPFFLCFCFLWNLNYHFNTDNNTESIKRYQQSFLKAWQDLCDEKTLLKIFKEVSCLSAVYAAFTYENLYKVADFNPACDKRNYLLSVGDCLRSFIKK